MSHQLTFADSEFSTKRRQTRKEIFLSRMEQILPWQNMTAVIEPFYPKAGNGRRPYLLISESAWEEMTCLFAPSLARDCDLFFS